MARGLKTFVTDAGFYELAVAAPSMQAALRAWDMKHNAFANGGARQSTDAAVIAAATAQPGVVLRRPIGSKALFRQHADLPRIKSGARRKAKAAPKPDTAKIRKAEAALEKARAAHDRRSTALQAAADAAQNQITKEDDAWQRTRQKLEADLARARKPV
jgi:colicin import membrane protein